MSQTHPPTPTTTNSPPDPINLIHQLHNTNATLALTPDGQHLKLDAPTGTITPEIRAALALHKLALIALLRGDPIIPRLPWELQNLVKQASTGIPLEGPEGVGDVGRYVLSYAASYAIGDRENVLEHLWGVWRANHPGEEMPTGAKAA